MTILQEPDSKRYATVALRCRSVQAGRTEDQGSHGAFSQRCSTNEDAPGGHGPGARSGSRPVQRRRGGPPLGGGQDDHLPTLRERQGAPRRGAGPDHGGTPHARHGVAPPGSPRVPRQRASHLRRRPAAEPVLRDLHRLRTRSRAPRAPAHADARAGRTDHDDLRERSRPRRATSRTSTTPPWPRSSRGRSSSDRCSGPRRSPTSTSKPWPTGSSPTCRRKGSPGSASADESKELNHRDGGNAITRSFAVAGTLSHARVGADGQGGRVVAAGRPRRLAPPWPDALRVGVEVVNASAHDLHRATQGPLLRRRLRRPRPAHRQGTTPMAPRRPRPRRGRSRRRASSTPTAAAAAHRRADRSPSATFLTETWLPHKRRHVRATTAYRYAWFVERYINPAIGDVPLRRLRADHLDGLYDAARHDRRAQRRRARTQDRPRGPHDRPRRPRPRRPTPARRPQRRPRAAHARRRPPTRASRTVLDRRRTAAPSSLRRVTTASTPRSTSPPTPACAAARSSDSSGPTSTAAPHDCRSRRTLQNVGGRPVEFGVKTRTSRRTVDLDAQTMTTLARWRRRLDDDGLPHGADDWMFCNATGRFLNPESVSQLFDRIVRRRSAAPHPVPRPAPHPRLAARRRRRPDQGRQRTPRPRPPRLHDAHLPAPAARHERRRRRAVRRPDRHREPVDVYRPDVRETRRSTRRATDEPVDDAGDALTTTTKAQVCDLGLHMVAGAGFEPATFGL